MCVFTCVLGCVFYHGRIAESGVGISWKQIVDLMLVAMVATCHLSDY